MENMTAAEMMEAMKSMTVEERMELLRSQRPELFQAPQISFGKAPKDGWKDSDRVVK